MCSNAGGGGSSAQVNSRRNAGNAKEGERE